MINLAYAIICNGEQYNGIRSARIYQQLQQEYLSDVSFPREKKDHEVIDKLCSVPNVNGYIYSLIDKDIHPDILTIKQIKERILPILAKHSIHEVYLFGSYARGEATNASDIDIYCESGDIKTFIDQGFLEDELEEALGKEIDIVFIGSKMDDFFAKQLDEDKISIT